MVIFARRVARLVEVTAATDTGGARIVYTVTGELFFASSNDLVSQFDYGCEAETVVIDLSGAHIWDASTVAALDAITTKYEARGKTVEIVGLNADSARGTARCPVSWPAATDPRDRRLPGLTAASRFTTRRMSHWSNHAPAVVTTSITRPDDQVRVAVQRRGAVGQLREPELQRQPQHEQDRDEGERLLAAPHRAQVLAAPGQQGEPERQVHRHEHERQQRDPLVPVAELPGQVVARDQQPDEHEVPARQAFDRPFDGPRAGHEVCLPHGNPPLWSSVVPSLAGTAAAAINRRYEIHRPSRTRV